MMSVGCKNCIRLHVLTKYRMYSDILYTYVTNSRESGVMSEGYKNCRCVRVLTKCHMYIVTSCIHTSQTLGIWHDVCRVSELLMFASVDKSHIYIYRHSIYICYELAGFLHNVCRVSELPMYASEA